MVIICTILIACSDERDTTSKEETVEYELEKKGNIKLEGAQPMFGKFKEHFEISKDESYLFFADRMLDQLFVFDSVGRHVSVIGERNKGPKGLVELSDFTVKDNNEVVIYDAAQRFLKTFDLSGKIINSVNFLQTSPISAFELAWYNDKIITSVVENKFVENPQNSKLVGLFNTDGKLDSLFGKHDPFTTDNNNFSIKSVISIDKERGVLYTNLKKSPFVQIYDMQTFERISYLGIETNNFRIPEKEIYMGLSIPEINKRSENVSSIVGIFTTECCVIQHMQVLTKEWFETVDFSKKENILILYNKETLEFIKEMPVDYILGTVSNNKLYFIEDLDPDNYTVGVYELVKSKK